MAKFLSNINLETANDIQFKTTAGANAGKISQTGDDLVISNAVGDILLGNGSDDVYIGDGTNAVDIRFEQNMAIFADSSSTRTLTLGGSNTNLVLESPTLNNATFGATTMNGKLTFTGNTGYILFDYEPSGDTGEYTNEVPLLKIDHNGTEKTILSRVSENSALQFGHDDTVAITAGDIGDTVKTNWGMTNENVVLAAEGGFYAWGWPNNHQSPYNSWSTRYEMRFKTDHYNSSAGDPAADALATNGLYIGSGSSTQFIDMSRNLKNIGTISSGAITSSGQITGTELEGTSLDINGNADIAGNLVVSAGSLSITADGSNATVMSESGSGDFEINTAGTMVLDSSGEIQVRDDGSTYGYIFKNGNNLAIKSAVNDGDIKLIGVDNNSSITALQLDMGDAGAAYFSSWIYTSGGGIGRDAHNIIDFSTDNQITFKTDNTTALTINSTGNATFASTITLPNSNTLTGSSGKVAFSGRVSGSTPTGTTDFTTKAYVDLQIANLSDSAPDTLNTLNELAAALGDDANFSTTVTNSIATKLPLAGGTMSGDIVMGNNDITGVKFIQANGNVDIRTGSGEYAIHATSDGQTALYNNGVKKFETTSVGIDVTGEVQGDSLDIDGNADISGSLDVGAVNADGNIAVVKSSAMIRVEESSGADVRMVAGGSTGYIGTYSNDTLQIQQNSGAAITIDTSRNSTFAGTISSGSITTTGHLQVSSSYPRIYLTDTDTNDDYSIINNNGTFIVYNDTDSSIPLAIAGDNKVTILGNLDFSNNKGLTWAGSHSVRVESNVLKLNASSGIEAQNSVEIGYQTNTSGTTGTTFLELDNNVGGDLSQQQTFIDFKFTDANANYTPQVRIGAQVGPDADADSIEKEGAGSFVVYTAPIGSDSSGNSSGLAESMRVSHDGDVTIAGSVVSTTLAPTSHMYLGATKHLYLDGGGDTYIKEIAGNEVAVYTGALKRLTVDYNGLTTPHNLVFSASGDILFPDNAGAALEFKEGSNLYMRFVTTNDSEKIEVNKNLTLATGSGLGFTLDGNTITGIDDSSEFTDDDNHIMTSAGIDDRISTRISGLTSNTGTVTGTGTDNRIAIWNGTTAIDSDSDFYVDGDTIFTHNLEAAGNITVAGTVDGRDVAADGAKAVTAHGWGNHASAGYLTSISSSNVTTALGFTPMNSSQTTISSAQATKLGHITVTAGVDLDEVSSNAEGAVQLAGAQTISGVKTFSAATAFTNTTNSTSKTTGAVKLSGGMGIAKALNVGEDVVAYASSDKRYKDNLQAITNPIDKVKSLTGYTFTWNDKHEQFNGNNDIGVVAQEVEKILPEIVDTRDNGYKAVKYEKMVALLIEAVKDQQKQIDELKEKCNGCSR